MTKIDVISGFLGAGKTTLIKKLIAEAYQGEKLALSWHKSLPEVLTRFDKKQQDSNIPENSQEIPKKIC